MAVDISGYGTTVDMIILPLFPTGITLTRFPGSSNPVDFPEMEIAGREMGVNGDLQYWQKAQPIDVSFSIIAESDEDRDLNFLFEAARPIRGKPNLRIAIPSCVITYPSGRKVMLSNGTLLKAPPDNTIEGEGKFSAKTYSFTFEYKINSR